MTVASFGAVALVAAFVMESGVGRDRVLGASQRGEHRILEFAEGPDSTVSVVAFSSGYRSLVIDGFEAAAEIAGADYMEWMGRLPLLLHPAPRRVLVIAFGTGQTANGVRNEGPEQLDIVELSSAVLEMAHLFPSNEGVLESSLVEAINMDGRAWLRRTDRRYDVVTLEPMPPNFAGVNALYSLEFYQTMVPRLNPGAVVAQWVPYHLLAPEHATAVAATFRAVFEDSVLWIDDVGQTGILLGRYAGGDGEFGQEWPGLERESPGRDLSPQQIRGALRLNSEQLARYAELGEIITDDNQLLAYGRARELQLYYGDNMHRFNMDLVARMAGGGDGTGRRP
jgi:spermidine synthase